MQGYDCNSELRERNLKKQNVFYYIFIIFIHFKFHEDRIKHSKDYRQIQTYKNFWFACSFDLLI